MSFYRSGSSSSSSQVSKLKKTPVKNLPFRRCYCGIAAPFQVSWSDKNPGRRYFGCRYWPDKEKDCGYYEWYDEDISYWYKGLLNEMKKNKKPSADPSDYDEVHQKPRSYANEDKMKAMSNADPRSVFDRHNSLMYLVKVMVGLLLFFIVILGIVLGVLING